MDRLSKMRVLKVTPHHTMDELIKLMKKESHPKIKEGLQIVILVKQGHTAKMLR